MITTKEAAVRMGTISKVWQKTRGFLGKPQNPEFIAQRGLHDEVKRLSGQLSQAQKDGTAHLIENRQAANRLDEISRKANDDLVAGKVNKDFYQTDVTSRGRLAAHDYENALIGKKPKKVGLGKVLLGTGAVGVGGYMIGSKKKEETDPAYSGYQNPTY